MQLALSAQVVGRNVAKKLSSSDEVQSLPLIVFDDEALRSTRSESGSLRRKIPIYDLYLK